MLSSLHPLVAENALFADIGKVFHPLFLLFGWILAGIYSVIPNYAVAIAGLTILIMLALTPVTVKSTRSMIAMQRLQPEMKKLQAKYKGPENRATLNEEMMKLYKENGTSPVGACLPTFLQIPFLIVLYSLIRGLSNVTKVKGVLTPLPRYIDPNTKISHDLVSSYYTSPKPRAIHMHSGIFGMDLSQTPLHHHGSNQGILIIPYLVLIGLSVFLQYFQMKQMNSRNPAAAAANPQMQTMQKVFPLLFGFFYLNIPAGAAIYMLISSVMRIGTQEVMFRTGMVTAPSAEREIGPASKATKTKEREVEPASPPASKKGRPAVSDGTGVSKATTPPKKPATGGGNGRRPPAGKRPAAPNGTNGASAQDDEEATPAPKVHPRSRSKRTRKAR